MKSFATVPPILRPLAASLLAAALVACGQTGTLHHPEDAPSKENYLLKRRASKPDTAPVPPAAPSPATATPTTSP